MPPLVCLSDWVYLSFVCSLILCLSLMVWHFPLFQVNCISTEFTPKKHGGEKGVPFRIQVSLNVHLFCV